MVRITTETTDDELVFKVEGCLAGEGVRAVDASWQEAVALGEGRRVRVDLTGVCHADGAGRELLSRIHRAGARFVTRGCVMPEVIREISAGDAVTALRS
jgi:anti-anti-sigma regulatory factor